MLFFAEIYTLKTRSFLQVKIFYRRHLQYCCVWFGIDAVKAVCCFGPTKKWYSYHAKSAAWTVSCNATAKARYRSVIEAWTFFYKILNGCLHEMEISKRHVWCLISYQSASKLLTVLHIYRRALLHKLLIMVWSVWTGSAVLTRWESFGSGWIVIITMLQFQR